MAHIQTNHGLWYPQDVSAGGDKVDAQKMFVDNIKTIEAIMQSAIMQSNSVSMTDLNTIFDYNIYPITGQNAVVSTANNIQIKYSGNGVEVRVYNGSAWGNWYSDSGAAYNQANNAYNQANGAYNLTNIAYNKAINAYNKANNAYNLAYDVYNQVTNTIHGQVNNAYNQANNAYSQANNAYNIANNAYSQANNAYNIANNIYSNPILTAQDNVPTSIVAGRFIGVWEE